MDSETQATAKLPRGFDRPDRQAATTAGRWRFLRAVARFTPALSELAKRPLAAYAIAEKNIDAEDADVWAIPVATSQRHYTVNVPPVDGIDWGRVAAEDPSAPPALINLRDELSTWADRFHLNAPWCMERAVATVAMWHSSPGYPRHHWEYGAVAGFEPLREDETKIAFDTAGLPLADAQRILTEHYPQLDRLIRERGYVKASQSKRNPAHFDWLAHYQVQEWPLEKIASHAGRARKTVKVAIVDAASLIGLPLRPFKRGRPRAT